MNQCRVTEAEARDVLLKAGVDESHIDGNAILFTAIVLDVIAQRGIKLLVEKLVEEMI